MDQHDNDEIYAALGMVMPWVKRMGPVPGVDATYRQLVFMTAMWGVDLDDVQWPAVIAASPVNRWGEKDPKGVEA